MKKTSRTKNSIFNVSSNLVVFIIKTLLSFVLRTIFIKILGEMYLGVNGLLSNVLSMLSLAELGISSAISFGLYKPLAEKDNKKVSSIMSFFKNVYEIIGFLVLIFGIVLYFFLDKIIKEYNSIPYLNIIYLLYLINTVSTYYTSYKEVLITADQKAYRLTKINIIFTLILYIFQIAVLIIFKNFIIYLIVQFLVQILQKIATNMFITREYKEIDFRTKEKVDDNTLYTIKKNVRAMILHKVGDYCVNGTDNIIISNMINVSTVGFYSNYNMLTSMLNSIITIVYNNLTASFGNLLVKEDRKKSLTIFKRIDFIAFIIYSFCGVMFSVLASRFIEIWIGSKYILDPITVTLIAFSFFFTGTRMACTIVRNASGMYSKDKWIPIIQSIINLIVSVILAHFIGLAGVILGTICSSILPNFYRIYILYKQVFKEKYSEYLIKYYVPYIVTFIVITGVSYAICNAIQISGIVGLVVSLLVSLVIYITIVCIIFRKYKEMNYLKDGISNIKSKLLNKSNGD